MISELLKIFFLWSSLGCSRTCPGSHSQDSVCLAPAYFSASDNFCFLCIRQSYLTPSWYPKIGVLSSSFRLLHHPHLLLVTQSLLLNIVTPSPGCRFLPLGRSFSALLNVTNSFFINEICTILMSTLHQAKETSHKFWSPPCVF